MHDESSVESFVTQAVGLAGFASLETGVYLVHRPSALIVGGLLTLAWAVLRSNAR
jgi:hypothetical protein